MKIEKIEEKIKIPPDLKVELVNNLLKINGPKGEDSRKLIHPKIKITLMDNIVSLFSKKPSKKEKKIINTFKAHIKNLIKGVKEGYIYKLKICSGHFPMNVSLKDKYLITQNFLGEKIPRKALILPGVKVDIQGDIIILNGINKEAVGQTAANIEKSTNIKARDKRIFQDGIFIIEKGDKKIK